MLNNPAILLSTFSSSKMEFAADKRFIVKAPTPKVAKGKSKDKDRYRFIKPYPKVPKYLKTIFAVKIVDDIVTNIVAIRESGASQISTWNSLMSRTNLSMIFRGIFEV